LDSLKLAAGGFWGRVPARHLPSFFLLVLLFLLFWLLQQLFGFCPFLGVEKTLALSPTTTFPGLSQLHLTHQ
jgi:hypothetical protein